MCFSKQKETKPSQYIRHYTNVKALFKILEGGLRFGEPRAEWDDLNDYFTLEMYKRHLGNDAKISLLCFCEGLGSAHHWYYYGYSSGNSQYENCYENIKCNIKLNKKKFEEKIKQYDLSLKPIEYVLSNKQATLDSESKTKTLAEYVDSWDKLPYVKRIEYDVEKEWRVIKVGNGEPNEISILDCVESITFLIDEDSPIYCILKNMIHCKYPQLTCKIDNSGVHKSKIWETEIINIINQKLIQL